jgi:hypothetical protein
MNGFNLNHLLKNSIADVFRISVGLQRMLKKSVLLKGTASAVPQVPFAMRLQPPRYAFSP